MAIAQFVGLGGALARAVGAVAPQVFLCGCVGVWVCGCVSVLVCAYHYYYYYYYYQN